jgi:hypothetical protein
MGSLGALPNIMGRGLIIPWYIYYMLHCKGNKVKYRVSEREPKDSYGSNVVVKGKKKIMHHDSITMFDC